MKQIRVLFVLHKTSLIGGSNRSFIVMLEGLRQKGIQPFVVMPDRKGIYSSIADMDIPTIITRYYDTVYPWLKSVIDYLLFIPRIIVHRTVNFFAIRKITKAVRNKGIMLVHTNVSISTIGYWVSRRLGIPHVYHIREYVDTDFGLHFFLSRNYFYHLLTSPNSYNICITKDIQRYFRQEGRPESRVIYNGIQESIDTMPHEVKKDYFLYAGRLIEAKGVLDMLEAYANYQKQATNIIPLYIIGDHPEHAFYNKLITFIQQNGLEDCVKIFEQRPDIKEFMMHAQAIVIPSRSEGFGRCMPEAMFCGCLAIGNNTAGTREQLDNGVEITGEEIALRYETKEQLTSLFHDISIHSEEYYTQYKERAFTTVNQLYSSENNIANVYSFFNDILGGKI